MIPFLVETLEELLRLLCIKFIRQDTLDAACTTYALLKADVTDTSNHKNVSDFDLGFALKYDTKILRSSKKYTEIQIYNFKKEAMQFLVTLYNHIMEKTPINSLFARCLSCLSPNHMAKWQCEKLFAKILEKLVLYKRILGKEVNTAKQEYSSFLRITMKRNKQ